MKNVDIRYFLFLVTMRNCVRHTFHDDIIQTRLASQNIFTHNFNIILLLRKVSRLCDLRKKSYRDKKSPIMKCFPEIIFLFTVFLTVSSCRFEWNCGICVRANCEFIYTIYGDVLCTKSADNFPDARIVADDDFSCGIIERKSEFLFMKYFKSVM